MEFDEKKEDFDKYKYEYFLKELETLSNYRAQFSNSRLLILGGSITFLASLVTVTKQAAYDQIVLTHVVMSLILFAVVRMIGSYSGAIYIFFDYIEHLEKEFKIHGFSHAWSRYLDKHNKYNATFACFVVCMVMVVSAFIYTVAPVLYGLNNDLSFKVLGKYKCIYIIIFSLVYFFLIRDVCCNIWPESIKKNVSEIREKYNKGRFPPSLNIRETER